MRYRVVIPSPSAKRLAANAKIVVTKHTGWEFDELVSSFPDYEYHDLEPGTSSFEFEVPDKYAWSYSNSIINGWWFKVELEYSNSTGSRKENYRLVPEKNKGLNGKY